MTVCWCQGATKHATDGQRNQPKNCRRSIGAEASSKAKSLPRWHNHRSHWTIQYYTALISSLWISNCSSVNVFPKPVDFHRYRRHTAAETAARTLACTKQIDCVTRTVLRRAATAARASLRSRPRFVTVSQMVKHVVLANSTVYVLRDQCCSNIPINIYPPKGSGPTKL